MRKITLLLLLFATLAWAKEKKTYPLAGTVIGFHTQPETGGVFNNGRGFIGTNEMRVYTVKTDSGTLELTTCRQYVGDCNGPARLSPGQSISYRIEKGYVYAVLDDGKEHRFYVMSSN